MNNQAMQRNTDFSVESSEDIRITYYKEKKDRFKIHIKGPVLRYNITRKK